MQQNSNITMVDTLVFHKNHPTHLTECPSLTKFSQEPTVSDIRAYIESSVDLPTINSYNYEIHIYNKKYRKYFMLEQNYLDKFKPFQCNNIVSGEESAELHTDHYVELEVIWSIKKNDNRVASEQILYLNERQLTDRLLDNNVQMPYEADQCSNTAQVSSVLKTMYSTQSDNNGISPSDTNYQPSSTDPVANKHDSNPFAEHDKDSTLSSTILINTQNSIDVLTLTSTDEKTSLEQCSDPEYIPTESNIPVYSSISNAYPASTILTFPENTVYDTNIQVKPPLSADDYSTTSKLNVCRFSCTTTNEYLVSKTKDSISSDEDFNVKPCFSETDCDETYRTAHKGPEIGRGSFGIVWSYLTKTKNLVAVKEIKLDEDNSERCQGDFKWVQEVYILRALDYRYIVKFYGISIEKTRLVKIFMEHLPHGTIHNMLVLFGPFHNNILQKYTRQIVDGVEYLHEMGVVHRDIKGKNVMLDKWGNIKLIDFGCAVQLKENSAHQVFKSMAGTLNWMAPEVVAETGHWEKADIWSIGCTLYEMATGKPPWSFVDNPVAVQIIIAHGTKPPSDLPGTCPATAHGFYSSCLTRDPTSRPSASELLRHEFLEY